MLAVGREWVRNQHQAKRHFISAQNHYLERFQAVIGGCPAVLVPGQYAGTRGGAKLFRALEQIADRAGAPIWLPGDCDKETPILIRGPGTGTLARALLVPPEVREWETKYGKVQAVVVPGQLFGAML